MNIKDKRDGIIEYKDIKEILNIKNYQKDKNISKIYINDIK